MPPEEGKDLCACLFRARQRFYSWPFRRKEEGNREEVRDPFDLRAEKVPGTLDSLGLRNSRNSAALAPDKMRG